MCSRSSWDATPAGSRSGATAAAPPGAMPGYFHNRHMLVSSMTAAILWFLSPPLLAWVSPALLGLFLAVPLSRASGSESLGRALVAVRAAAHARGSRAAGAGGAPHGIDRPSARSCRRTGSGIWRAIARRDWRTSTATCRGPADPRGHPDPHAFTAQQKLIDARSLEEALEWFTPIERVEVAGDARLLNQLALLPDAQRHTFII